MRRAVARVACGSAIGLALAAAVTAVPWAAALYGHVMPGPRTPRITAVTGITGIWTGRSYAYLLAPKRPCAAAGQYVLVDTGSDPSGVAIRAALSDVGCTPACVGTVLLTHGHSDHTAGLGLFAHAQVLASPADGALLRGDVGPRSPLMRMVMRLTPRQRHVLQTTDVYPGHVLDRGGQRLTAIGLPGHTEGSMGYLVAGGLIAGDAVEAASVRDIAYRPYPARLAEHPAALAPGLLRLKQTPLRWVADGHTGLVCRDRP